MALCGNKILMYALVLQDKYYGDAGCRGDAVEVVEEVFVSLTRRASTLGRQGTKAA